MRKLSRRPSFEAAGPEVIVERFTAHGALDWATERIALKYHDVPLRVVSGGWVVESQIHPGNDGGREASEL